MVTPSAAPSIGWSQFQGGSDHLADADSSLVPPLRQAWRAAPSSGSQASSGAVIVGDVAVAVSNESVYAVDLATGEAAWRLDRDGGPLAMPAVGTAGGRDVLVYTEGDTASKAAIVAVDPSDRSELWRDPLKNVSGSGVTIAGDEAFVGDRSGNLYGFGLQDGAAASWSPMGLGEGSVDAPPAASSNEVVVTERTHDTGAITVQAVDPSTGDERWSYSAGVSAGTATSSTLDDRHAIFGVGGEQHLRAEDLGSKGDAVTAWTAHTRSTFSPLSAPAEAGGTVFVVSTSSSDAALYAFDAADGTKRWDFQFQVPAIVTSPVVIGGTVYVGTDEGVLAGIDVASGIEVWQADTGPGAMAALAASGDILVAGKRGSRGGLVAFRHDPSGRLLHVESSTKLHVGTDAVRYLIAFLAVFAVAFGGALGLRRRRSPDAGAAAPATEGTGPPELPGATETEED